MNDTDRHIQTLLRQHGLRRTGIRLEMLNVLLNGKQALSHAGIEERLAGRYDRVTVYRTLRTFEEKGLIHKVPDETAAVKYALCDEGCPDEEHDDTHIHFKCRGCEKTFCLKSVAPPHISLPEGFSSETLHVLAVGLCGDCEEKQ